MTYASGEDPQIGDTVGSVATGIKYKVVTVDSEFGSVTIENIDNEPFDFSADRLNLVERKPPVHGFRVGDVLKLKHPTLETQKLRWKVVPPEMSDYDRVWLRGGDGDQLFPFWDYPNEYVLADHHTADDIGTAAQEESWIAEAQRIINGNRADDYGTAGAEDTADAIAAVWSGYLGHEITVDDFCWLMVLLKAVRDKHKSKRDNKVDAHGYLLLMEKHAATPEETR